MTTSTPPQSIADIPGWFRWADQRLFEHFLSADEGAQGDLVELGAYLGKSSALIGNYQRPGEIFIVCDLFGGQAGDESNQKENRRSYSKLSRAAFERNYLAFHDHLPVIVEGASSTILDHVKPGSVRFVHVDASHLYEQVAVDLDSARTMLVPGGVAVFDDFRSPHTPGVAAAVWEGVFTKQLRPICVSPSKLYGTFGDPRPHRERLQAWLQRFQRCPWETQPIAGDSVVRILEPPRQRSQALMTQADVAKLISEMSKVADATGTVSVRMTRLEQDVAQLGRVRGWGLEGAMRRAAGKVRSWRAQG